MRIYNAIIREIPENLKSLLLMNVLSAISVSAMIATVSVAAKGAAGGQTDARLMLMFAITVALTAITHHYTLVTASQDAERMIQKMRVRLFDLIRKTDILTVDQIGHAKLQGVLTQDTQVLSQVLPILVIGFQQAVILVFLAFYLAWLSPLACILAFSLAGIAIAVRFKRIRLLHTLTQSAAKAEERVFKGLTELLQGFKEVRMNGPRADGVVGALAKESKTSRTTTTTMKIQWGRNYAVLESMLHSLVGLMVFVVPLFVAGYHEIILQATIAVLFITGPVATVSFVIPMVSQADLALESIESMQETLRVAAGEALDETARTLETPPSSITLKDTVLSYKDADKNPLFTVGPLAAEFHAGKITFITGGNGSGKSTMLRLLTGLIPLDAGTILVNGETVASDQMQDYRDQFSAIFSNFHLSRRLYGIADPDPARISRLLTRLELQDKVSVKDATFSTIDLSTGQRKRLAFIVAELEDKPVIVLDEWAADQDPHFRRIFYEELLPELKARGKIVICVTHDDRWFHIADNLYHMNEGRIEYVRMA
jgi:putative ATP-binding cassette transporter